MNVLEAREGIGGHCLPKDAKMFLQTSVATKSKIVAAAINVDQDYRKCRERENRSAIKAARNFALRK